MMATSHNWKPGDYVRFAHQAAEGPDYRVKSVSHDPTNPAFEGFVTLDSRSFSGEFAPHLFVKGIPPQ